jgi:perosamine synthetase
MIPLFKTYWDNEDIESMAKVIRRGTYWAIGPEIEEFEKKIAEYLRAKFALAFNSGTSALHTLLLAHDIKGREVIVPSFTFIATANAVLLAGGIPVFAESEQDTFGLDAEDVKKRITPKTKAIMTLDYGGFPSRDMLKLKKIAKENNLLFIEDAAEALGSKICEQYSGTFGDSSIISFCQNKVLATGEGGMIITNDRHVYEKAKLLRSHGRLELEEDYFASTADNDYIQPGFNFRMPSVIAALGLTQFNKMEKVIGLRREHAEYLTNQLSRINGVTTPKEIEGHYAVYQMYTIRLPDKKTRDRLQIHLKNNGVMSKVYFNCIHLKTIYKNLGYKEGDLPKSELLSDLVLNIPLYPDITVKELDHIIKCIREGL